MHTGTFTTELAPARNQIRLETKFMFALFELNFISGDVPGCYLLANMIICEVDDPRVNAIVRTLRLLELREALRWRWPVPYGSVARQKAVKKIPLSQMYFRCVVDYLCRLFADSRFERAFFKHLAAFSGTFVHQLRFLSELLSNHVFFPLFAECCSRPLLGGNLRTLRRNLWFERACLGLDFFLQ